MHTVKKIAVVGGGSFGTAIANMVAEKGFICSLWMRDKQTIADIKTTRVNTKYLPESKIHNNVEPTDDLALAITDSQIIFISIPSTAFRTVVSSMALHLQNDQILISTTKGIEASSFELMSQILKEVVPYNRIGVLSGPNLAKEIVQKKLTGTVIASDREDVRLIIQDVLHSEYFRVFASTDIYGVELGGALKNIFAIAAGMAASLDVGMNAISLLISRSLTEMSRFAVHLGGNPMTFVGLSGVGDLIVTCNSPLSRNYRVGYALGQGKTLDEAVNELGSVAEGVNTLKLVKEKAEVLTVSLPIVEGLYKIVFEGHNVHEVVHGLMIRPQHSKDVEFVLNLDDS